MELTVWILEKEKHCALVQQKLWSSLYRGSVLIRIFSSSEDLLNACRNRLPDVITGELLSPCPGGSELLPSLRQLGPVDLFPVTSNHSTSSFTLAQRCGIMDYIVKPFSKARLSSGIRRYLRHRQSLSLSLTSMTLSQNTIDDCLFSSASIGHSSSASLSPSSVANYDRIRSLLPLLSSPQGITMRELQLSSPVSRTTLLKDLKCLVEEGLVVRECVLTHHPGRPEYRYYLLSRL